MPFTAFENHWTEVRAHENVHDVWEGDEVLDEGATVEYHNVDDNYLRKKLQIRVAAVRRGRARKIGDYIVSLAVLKQSVGGEVKDKGRIERHTRHTGLSGRRPERAPCATYCCYK